MKENTKNTIEKIIKNTVAEHKNIFLVNIDFSNEKQSLLLKVFVDTDEGISLNKCAELSRKISTSLEEKNCIEMTYNIMVSSPGLTRSLTHNRQFKKSIGRDLTITYSMGNKMESANFKLLSFDNKKLSLENENHEIVELERDKIKSTLIKLKW